MASIRSKQLSYHQNAATTTTTLLLSAMIAFLTINRCIILAAASGEEPSNAEQYDFYSDKMATISYGRSNFSGKFHDNFVIVNDQQQVDDSRAFTGR